MWLNAYLQVAVKNNIDVFYFSCNIPMHMLFVDDGEMDKRVFLATWKDIPSSNEVQSTITNVAHNAGNVKYNIGVLLSFKFFNR